jgi:transcriptional regulator with XRE-family HTH domain
MSIGKAIKKLREEHGMSQTELAHKSGILNQTSISQIESDRKMPREKNLRQICKALGVSFGGIHLLAIEDSDIKTKAGRELYDTIYPLMKKVFLK